MARILIVEDESHNAECAAVILMGQRHTVTVAGNGLEALMLLDAVPFDLVLTDVLMPMMDGLTLMQVMRGSTGSYRNLPVIAMTAKTDLETLDALREAGANQIVTKPFRNSTLIEIVSLALAEAARAAQPRQTDRV